jgi:hypothetical protein
MFTGRDVLVGRERRRDAMAFAEKERLIRSVTRVHPPFGERYQRWLARLGARLVVWGHQLQDRYAQPAIRPLALERK